MYIAAIVAMISRLNCGCKLSGVRPGKKEMLNDSTHVVKRSRWPRGGLLDYRLSVGIYELLFATSSGVGG